VLDDVLKAGDVSEEPGDDGRGDRVTDHALGSRRRLSRPLRLIRTSSCTEATFWRLSSRHADASRRLRSTADAKRFQSSRTMILFMSCVRTERHSTATLSSVPMASGRVFVRGS
jgi:hypothetical protein